MMFQPQTRRVTVNLNLKNRLIKIITFLTIILLKIIATLLRIRSEKRFVGQKNLKSNFDYTKRILSKGLDFRRKIAIKAKQ